jgi:FkbM family methyltransferase
MSNKLIQYSVNLLPWQIRSWIKHIPVVSQLQRWFFERFLAGQEFIHTINAGPAKGLRYPISLPQDKGIWTGTYETNFALALVNSVQAGDICYDIGAYRGFFSGILALAGAKLVVMFEPLPENCTQLQHLIETNPQLPLKLESMAVGDQDGEIEFNVMPEASMGKIQTSPFQLEVEGERRLQVPIYKLDNLVISSKLPPPKVMKIDVEGAEMQVLQGASEVLKMYHPSLYIEAHSHELSDDCNQFLTGLGYKHITVLETGLPPNPKCDPEICHLICTY